MEHDLETVRRVQPERDAIIASIAETGCVPLDVLGDLFIASQDRSSRRDHPLPQWMREVVEEFIDLSRLIGHLVGCAEAGGQSDLPCFVEPGGAAGWTLLR
jgi:hypothetical protein